MKAHDLMTTDPACVTSDDTVRRAAQLMAEHDCGCLPVLDGSPGERVVGVITDRDIAVRGVARGMGADALVRDLMTRDPAFCPPEASVDDVQRLMSDRQVRRVVIVDADRRPLGIIAQADLARAAERGAGISEREVARVVERISEPATAGRGRAGQGSTLEQTF